MTRNPWKNGSSTTKNWILFSVLYCIGSINKTNLIIDRAFGTTEIIQRDILGPSRRPLHTPLTNFYMFQTFGYSIFFRETYNKGRHFSQSLAPVADNWLINIDTNAKIWENKSGPNSGFPSTVNVLFLDGTYNNFTAKH